VILHLGQALVALLKADAGVTAQCQGRVFRGHAAQKETRSRITYRRQSEDEYGSLGGLTEAVRTRMELWCWGGQQTPAKDAEYLAEAVRQCINGFAGPPGTSSKYPANWGYEDAADGSNQSIVVQYANLVGASDEEQPPPDGSERFPEAVQLEVDIFWNRGT
jgi:hypothetical protein